MDAVKRRCKQKIYDIGSNTILLTGINPAPIPEETDFTIEDALLVFRITTGVIWAERNRPSAR